MPCFPLIQDCDLGKQFLPGYPRQAHNITVESLHTPEASILQHVMQATQDPISVLFDKVSGTWYQFLGFPDRFSKSCSFYSLTFSNRWKQWKQKCHDDSETHNWLTANTKLCPKCSKPVEKNGGCNLVVCRCGQVPAKVEYSPVCAEIRIPHSFWISSAFQLHSLCVSRISHSDESAHEKRVFPDWSAYAYSYKGFPCLIGNVGEALHE